MEEMQRKIDEARAAYRETLDDSDEVQAAAWAAYMDVFFQVSQFNKANGTKTSPPCDRWALIFLSHTF